MGAQNEDERLPNFDRRAEAAERDVHDVTLAPFFISRFEMTQAQWQRLTAGPNPSVFPAGAVPNKVRTITPTNPVENVSWDDCTLWLGRHGLELPTEAQWEYACRAGTHTPWSCGAVPELLAQHANIADQIASDQAWACEAWDDGHAVHAPVGSFAPNPFGLHDMHGNVWEWAQDRIWGYNEVARAGDGLRGDQSVPGPRVYRGGGYSDPAYKARSSNRDGFLPNFGGPLIGVRPARMLVE
jgi:formylglycine-generating enzyme required for sulfatase activity